MNIMPWWCTIGIVIVVVLWVIALKIEHDNRKRWR